MIRHSLRGTHTQVAIVEDQINSMGDRANCQKGDYPNLTLGDDVTNMQTSYSDHSGLPRDL